MKINDPINEDLVFDGLDFRILARAASTKAWELGSDRNGRRSTQANSFLFRRLNQASRQRTRPTSNPA